MQLTADDIPILYAALLAVLYNNEDLWDELSQDGLGHAESLLSRLEEQANEQEAEAEDEEDYEN